MAHQPSISIALKLSLSIKHVAFIWLAGILLAITSVATVYYYESKQMEAQLERRLETKIHALGQTLDSTRHLMFLTRAFLENSNQASQRQFEQFLSGQTGTDRGVHSIVWAPKTAIEEIPQLEKAAATHGFLGYRIEPPIDPQTHLPTFLQGSTLPIYYVSSIFEASDDLGVRLESRTENLYAITQSFNHNRIGVAHYEHDNQTGIRLFLPLYADHQQLKGCLVANIVLHELLGLTWKEDINSADSHISVYSEAADKVIFQSHINTSLSDKKLSERTVTLEKPYYNALFDQHWIVSVSMVDRTGSTAMYGATLVALILALTVSATLSANFYATRLKVSDRVIAEKTQSLAIQAVKDSLTGLSNRSALAQEVELRLAQLKLGQTKGFSILFIDLDRFKVINDSMGHLHGDRLLQLVAQRLTANCRNHDVSFRFGGDEFVICLPELTDKQRVSQICKRYAQLLSQPYILDGQRCYIGASIGISIVTDYNRSLTEILREADTAMYQAKSSSHDKVVFFHETMFQKAKQRFTLEQELTNALALKQLSLVYQPIYETQSDEIVGFESLLRWNHPKFGHVSPDEFIPIAEETGLIISIGDWVAKECCKTLQRLWHDPAIKVMPRININVSAKQFESEHIYKTLSRLLSHCDFPAHFIGVEITESMLLSDDCSAQQLQRIKDLGITLYLDDFGTGYSSLSVINDYPVDVIKVDRSFVSRIALGQTNADSLCQAIINLAHTIDLKVVAEGVETPQQLAILTQYQCHYVQGYLKSKPVSVCKLEQCLNQQNRQSA
ncbi:bifunctional diguanylate cyclase/phosphodiesterase [Vibrio sinaloensis]|uniref:bifunctional diguanylate cyclase/phosphodiesterase n=1 Tax=Photobacterium sp. (strain ATCC 43367) TaxID=379097 RepID=UPI0009E61261|nr:EAL domain-containing protein [Vibrio sinaloensis]